MSSRPIIGKVSRFCIPSPLCKRLNLRIFNTSSGFLQIYVRLKKVPLETSRYPVLIEKKRRVQYITGSFAQSVRNAYEFRIIATYKTNTIDFDVEIIMTNFEM